LVLLWGTLRGPLWLLLWCRRVCRCGNEAPK
jgi:hypothetical protein